MKTEIASVVAADMGAASCRLKQREVRCDFASMRYRTQLFDPDYIDNVKKTQNLEALRIPAC